MNATLRYVSVPHLFPFLMPPLPQTWLKRTHTATPYRRSASSCSPQAHKRLPTTEAFLNKCRSQPFLLCRCGPGLGDRCRCRCRGWWLGAPEEASTAAAAVAVAGQADSTLRPHSLLLLPTIPPFVPPAVCELISSEPIPCPSHLSIGIPHTHTHRR